MPAREAYSWRPESWMGNVAEMRPSSGGAQGVIFVWEHFTPLTGRASFVIKPLAGSAAPTKFAEFMLDKVGGAVSPESQPIARNSPAGDAIVRLLRAYSRAAEAWSDEKSRWTAVFPYYDSAQALVLQETQCITEMAEAYREQHGLRNILRNPALMTNLGRLFAADAIIGNGDRLCQVNSGNIAFNVDGSLSAIDSTAVLTNYNALFDDRNLSRADLEADSGGASPQDWARNMIKGQHGQVATPEQAARWNPDDPSSPKPVLAPGFTLKFLFDVDKWWDLHFKGHFESGMKKENQQRASEGVPPLVPPREGEWAEALANFKIGVEEGQAAADKWLSGLKWLRVKSKYEEYVSKYGGDPNLDWTNLKIRRLYYKARRAGGGDKEAMAAVQDYVARKFPGI